VPSGFFVAPLAGLLVTRALIIMSGIDVPDKHASGLLPAPPGGAVGPAGWGRVEGGTGPLEEGTATSAFGGEQSVSLRIYSGYGSASSDGVLRFLRAGRTGCVGFITPLVSLPCRIISSLRFRASLEFDAVGTAGEGWAIGSSFILNWVIVFFKRSL